MQIALPPGARAPRVRYPPSRVFHFAGRSYPSRVERHDVNGIRVRAYGAANGIQNPERVWHYYISQLRERSDDEILAAHQHSVTPRMHALSSSPVLPQALDRSARAVVDHPEVAVADPNLRDSSQGGVCVAAPTVVGGLLAHSRSSFLARTANGACGPVSRLHAAYDWISGRAPAIRKTLGARRTALAVLGMAVGCSSPTEPAHLAVSLQTARFYEALPPITVVTAHDSLHVSGAISLNEPCYDFTATASLLQDSLSVTLVAARKLQICLQALAVFSYSITITGVPSGSLAFRLVYDRRGPPTFVETALEQVVEVP